MITEKLGDVEISYSLYPRKNKNGEYEIYYRFEFSLKGNKLTDKRISVSTGVRCNVEDWDGNYVTGRSGTAMKNNKNLDKAKNFINQGLQQLIAKGQESLPEIHKEIQIGIKPKITGKKLKGKYKNELSTLQDHAIESIKTAYITDALQNKGLTENTQLKYDITVRYFKTFWKQRYQKDEALISLITLPDMDEFKRFLAQQPKNKKKPEKGTLDPDTVRTYLSKMKALFNFAALPRTKGGLGLIEHVPIREGLIGAYDESDRTALAPGEIETIWNLDDHNLSEPLRRVKYEFLFMLGSGVGFKEMKSIKPEHIEVMEDGSIYLSKRRTKNQKKFAVTLLPFAEYAYQYYFSKQPNLFDVVKSETNERKYLKQLVKLAFIDEKVTPYVGRTSFITNLLSGGVDKYQVKEMVGHSSFQMFPKYDKHIAKIKVKEQQRMYAMTDIGRISLTTTSNQILN